MKVILLTGSAPPDACGVGDYTGALAAALEQAGQEVEVLCHRDWSFAGTLKAVRRVAAAKNALLHIQYPTMGYRYSLGPQICSLLRKSVVTLHEYSLAHRLRKLSLTFFSIRSPRVIATSYFERDALAAAMPWVEKRLQVIPIGSNIPSLAAPTIDRQHTIVYFGLIMPRKGLEDFIEFARAIRSKGFRGELQVVGKVVVGQEGYAKQLMELDQTLDVKWMFDRNSMEVSEILSSAGLCYLPFPDGASERRGSLKAVCAAGLPCITTQSAQTGTELRVAVTFAETPAIAAETAMRLMESPERRHQMSLQALDYARKFTWEAIAQSHIRIYKELEDDLTRREVYKVRIR